MARNRTSYYLLEALCDLGVEYIFANLGTDHVSLIEDLAVRESEGKALPKVVLCPHENVAIHMAGGYASVTGRAQAVLVHVDVGTANAALGAHNLFRRRAPVLLIAGKAPMTLHGELPGSRDHFVHYVQDPFDIGGLVRPFVKWEYELRTGVNVKEVLRRMHSVAHSAPPGPAYLTVARETLAQAWNAEEVLAYPEQTYGAVPPGGCAPEVAIDIARRLLTARDPCVVTSYLGRSASAVAELEALAAEAGLRVVEHYPSDLNLRRDSPFHCGFDSRAAATSDLVLLLDVDVPWITGQGVDGAVVVHVDVDPVKKDFPMWGFPTHLRVQGDCCIVLRQVREAAASLLDDTTRTRIEHRVAALRHARAERSKQGMPSTSHPADGSIDVRCLCERLRGAIDDEDIVVNEAVRNAAAVLEYLPRRIPGTYIGPAGGGLGFSGGMALGAKLASPQSRVVQVVGDGSFHLGTPTSVYGVSQQYGIPIFSVVLDNGGWAAVKHAARLVHGDGAASRSGEFQARLGGAVRRFEQVASAFGAHGEGVERAEEIDGALERCLSALERRQSAVMRVAIADF